MEPSFKTPPGRSLDATVMAAAKALCLIGFPAIPMFVYLSNKHPSLDGSGAAQQIGQLADAAGTWAQVHFAFSVGGFLGLAVVLILRGQVAERAPQLWTNVAAAVGVVGGVIFTGTVLMEVTVIPALSTACAASPACLGPDNAVMADALADQGWRVLPGLTVGGRTLMVGLALLALLGVLYGSLRTWEGAALFFGAVLEIVANTGLHAWGNFRPASGMPGMAALAILAAGCGIAYSLFKRVNSGTGESGTHGVQVPPPTESVPT